ncbi:MAG: GMC oxidoreductase, partial [Parvibaculaceae bacterium]
YEAEPALIERMIAYEKSRLAFDEGIIVKDRSAEAKTPVDIHIFSCGGRRFEPQGWYWQLWVGLMTARSRGQVRPMRRDGALHFAIEHNHLSDEAGHDMRVMMSGIASARRIAAAEPLASMLRSEIAPGPSVKDAALESWARDNHVCYFHPAGSCPIGNDPEAGAVVDEKCRVHGLKGVMVADASVMPQVTAANTNIPTAALAHRLARHIDAIAG